MKKSLILFALFTSLFAFSASAFAQVKTAETVVDPLLEADANHNLEVAQNYFRTRKAYKAVIMRFEETFAAYPEYSKIDEFLYIAGMSSFYLGQNKGKQKINVGLTDEEKKKYTPEKLQADAKMYLTMVVEKYPNSKFKADAEKALKTLK